MKLKFMWFLLLFLLISIANYAQTSKREFKIANIEASVDRESKAFKNFKKSYPDVTNESWSTDKGYYFVKFKDGDVKNKIVYTRNGKIDYALKLYSNESFLPRSIISAVKGTYYDYKILDAQELILKHRTVYLVKITDSNSWKTIRVSDGNLEEIENYSSVISPCK